MNGAEKFIVRLAKKISLGSKRQAKEKECPGCGRIVKRFARGTVCGQCASNTEVMARIPKQEDRPISVKAITLGPYQRKEGSLVEVITVYTDDDEIVIEYTTKRSEFRYFKTAADFAKEFQPV